MDESCASSQCKLQRRRYRQPHPDYEATFVTALIAGASKVDRSKQEAAQLVESDLCKCKVMAPGSKASSKEEAVTWGLLRRCPAGLRAAAFL